MFLNNVSFNHILFADDSVLVAPSPNGLQTLVNMCSSIAVENDITFNAKKTKLMCFKPTCLKVPNIMLDGQIIDSVSSHKYLGVYICDDFNDEIDIKRQIRGIYARGNAVVKCFRHCTSDVKSLIFKAYCSSFYCSQLWCHFSSLSITKLKVAYNRIFRYLFNLPQSNISISSAMLDLNVTTFNAVLRKYMSGFVTRISNCDNEIINVLTKCVQFYKSSLSKQWCRDLYVLDL